MIKIRGHTDKGLITKIHKQHVQCNIKKPNQKMGRSKQFSKEDIQMANRHMKRCSPSLIIREMQIKIAMNYHLIPVRVPIIKNV